MRIIIAYLFFLLVIASSEAQNKLIYFNGVKDSDRLVRFTGLYGFTDLTKSSDKLRFRYIGDNSGIEIWTNDNKTYNGQILCYAVTYDITKKPQKHYRKITQLDTAAAREVYNLFDSLAVFNVPPEDSIVPENLRRCNDCDWYLIEYSTPKYYSLKGYASGNINDFKPEIPIAFLAYKLWERIPIYLTADKNFMNCLPKGEYAVGGMGGMVILHQPKRKYRLKSIEESN